MKVLRLPQVMNRTGLARSTIYKLMDSGDFPKPIPLMKRCVGWLEAEVEEWICERVTMRDESKNFN
ncbi:AlpA family transcriptional regulator [Marinospirillum perlucidum]|uniref:AlpA family transcriptional regulator n=1 Tax=Marinospirillum perlucidum TaxID=1982602 RepID=UPI000DF1E65E|nr:AlpA family transcriptional regulator [Marinospirillum perlucidum]